MIDPKDLLVYVVGIERYEGGTEWEVPGAVRDALDFAKWLIERGLPPQNIHAFLSPSEDGDSVDSRSTVPRGVVVHPAKTADLYEALNHQLQKRQPARFCLFWGGHGCVKQETRDRILAGADATLSNIQGINLTQFLRFLETDLVGWGKGDDQRDFVIIVDACAAFLYEHGLDRRIVATPFPLSSNTNRDQFSLFSSRVGQRAQNRDRERTGAFSKELHARLKKVRNLDGLFDLEKISDSLIDQFKLSSRGGVYEQTPVSCEVIGFGGRKRVFGNDTVAWMDEHSPTHAVPRGELAKLCILLTGFAPPIPAATVRELYSAATPLQTPAPASTKDLECLLECVLVLCHKPGERIFTFLESLRRIISDEAVRERITEWENRVAGRLQIDISAAHTKASFPSPTPPSYRVIQIVVAPTFGFGGKGFRYRVHAAVCSMASVPSGQTSTAFEVIGTPSRAVAVDRLYDVVHEAFRVAFEKVASEETASLGTIRVEAILPKELLPLGALEWKAWWGARHLRIDSRCELALRSYERGYVRNYDGPRLMQRDKWRRSQQGLAEMHIAWSERMSELDEQMFDRWDSDDTLAFCALSLDGDRQLVENAIERLIGAGIPIGLWFWQPSHPANGWKQAICERFVAHPTHGWPQRALQFQKCSTAERLPACKGVALLWDNPDQPLVPLPTRDSAPFRAPKTGMGA